MSELSQGTARKMVANICAPPSSSPPMFSFYAQSDELLLITQNGFYVRGKKVPQDEGEAATVYAAFKDWLQITKAPTCCAGGPQWGHAWDCKKCPD